MSYFIFINLLGSELMWLIDLDIMEKNGSKFTRNFSVEHTIINGWSLILKNLLKILLKVSYTS